MRFLEYQILKISFKNKSKTKKAHIFDPQSGLKMVGRACLYGLLSKLFGGCLSVCLSVTVQTRTQEIFSFSAIRDYIRVNSRQVVSTSSSAVKQWLRRPMVGGSKLNMVKFLGQLFFIIKPKAILQAQWLSFGFRLQRSVVRLPNVPKKDLRFFRISNFKNLL